MAKLVTAAAPTPTTDGPPEAADSPERAGRRRAGWRDGAGVAAVVVAGLAYLSPALKDGWYFGPYDAGANGTIGHPGNPVDLPVYNRLSGDLINQGIPWNMLDWRLVHAGQFPLWNPYNVLGLPQFLNFESGVLSLPDLLSYAVPLRLAWFVIALAKLLIAGTGTYVLARQLRAGALGSAFAGISFMLSGGFANWIGWSVSGVVAWAPWICAFVLLAYRDRRPRFTVLLACSVMFAFFGGFPELYALLAGALAVFLLAGAVYLLAARRRPSLRGGLRVALGLLAGSALAAPLLLPGAQLLTLSTHAASGGRASALAPARLSLLLAAGYYGIPIRTDATFPGVNYYETVAYVGAIAVALAVAGIVLARRQVAVVAIGALTVACIVAAYDLGAFDPTTRLLDLLGLPSVHPNRVRLVAGLGVAVLGGVGLDRLWRLGRASARLTWVGTSLLGAGLVAALVISSASEHLTGRYATARFDSLIWPCGLAAALVVSAAVLVASSRLRPAAGRRARLLLAGGLFTVQSAFLIFSGVGINTWGNAGYRPYPAATELRRIVGDALVGLDGRYPGSPKTWPRLGFYPNVNIAYEVAEFASHDPLLPVGYAHTFPVPSPTGHGQPTLSALMSPYIPSASVARSYGISYLLVQPGYPEPAGTTLVATLSGERLVRVVGSERFSFLGPYGAAGPPPGTRTRPGSTVVSWSHPSDNTWKIRVRARGSSAASRLLLLRITRVPGFSVTDDGHTLAIRPYGRFEMSVVVPPGDSTLTVTYWPQRLTDGVEVAAGAAAILAVWCALPIWWRRRRRRAGAGPRQALHRRSGAAASS